MSRLYDSNVGSLIYLPSLQQYFCPETGRSNFLECILKIVDATGHRYEFDNEPLSCIQVKNQPYSPLFINAELRYVDGRILFRQIDVRMPKYRVVLTDGGFPLSVTLQINNTEHIRYNGLVLEQEYGGAYTGKVDSIDLIGLSEGLTHLERWGAVIMDAGYVKAAAIPSNVMHTNNKYVFEQEFRSLF